MRIRIIAAIIISVLMAMLYIVNPDFELILLILAIFFGIATIMILVLWLFDRKFKFQYAVGFLAFTFIILFTRIHRQIHQRNAAVVQNKIEEYKLAHSDFPLSLDHLEDLPRDRKLFYIVDSNRNEYEFEYYLNASDRWHYDSESQTWTLNGEYD